MPPLHFRVTTTDRALSICESMKVASNYRKYKNIKYNITTVAYNIYLGILNSFQLTDS